jgi:curved DNA-binding protein
VKYKDYYKILDVPRDASDDAIKKAYRKLARKYHPDVSEEPNAKERFQDVSEAYETLKDKEKRAAYDSLGSYRPGQEFRPPPDWSERFGQQRFSGDFGDIDLSDLFAAFGGGFGRNAGAGFGPRAGGGARRGFRQGGSVPIPGEDYEVTVRLTLDEAFTGTEREFRIGNQTVRARIPKGATDGERLRLRGKGGPGMNGGPSGDLYLVISLVPHALYRVNGRDLDLELPVAPWEAALGAQIEVPTLEGEVKMKLPPGSKSGQKLRLAGKGLPRPGGGAGDLYAVIMIVVPGSPSERERQLYEQLKDASRADPRSHLRR